MDQTNIIERAFELAKSGQVSSLEKLAYRLKREGFPSVHSHLLGRAIRKQLTELIKANQPTAEVQSEKQTDLI